MCIWASSGHGLRAMILANMRGRVFASIYGSPDSSPPLRNDVTVPLIPFLDRDWLFPRHTADVRPFVYDDVECQIVRDDLLHPVAGGNKARKLDGLVPAIEKAGVTNVVTCGGAQSAHAASVAAIFAERGITPHILLRGEATEPLTGYALLSDLYGKVTRVDRDGYAKRDQMLKSHKAMLENEGHENVRIIPEGGHEVYALLGLVRQVYAMALTIPEPYSTKFNLVVDSATGTTAAGLALGVAYLKLPWTVEAVRLIQGDMMADQNRFDALTNAFIDEFGEPRRTPEVVWNERTRPRRFGRIFPDEMALCVDIARKTGVAFDPIYTLAAYDFVAGLRRKNRKRAIIVFTGGPLHLFGLVQRMGGLG